MSTKLLRQILPSLAAMTLFTALHAQAQRIEEVRENRVKIVTDGLNFETGQHWEAIDGSGQVVGWIEIMVIKDKIAFGHVREGRAVQAANLRLKEEKTITTKDENIRPRKWFIGPSFMQAQVTAKSTTATVDMSGTQWGVQLGMDQVLTPRQILRLRVGNDLISAKGTTSDTSLCDGDGDCELWTHFLTGSLGFVFQAMPEGHSWNVGLSTGFAGFLPVSRESDIINTQKISIDGGFEAGVFASVKTNPITWLEFSAQQVFLRETTTTSYKLTRLNLAWIQNF